MRGLCETERETILVGISPATLLEIDWRRGRLVDLFSYSTDPRVCVHGLECSSVPSHEATGVTGRVAAAQA